jgi:hypothetical protein
VNSNILLTDGTLMAFCNVYIAFANSAVENRDWEYVVDRGSSPIAPTPPEPSPTLINHSPDDGLFSIVTNIAEGKDSGSASIAVFDGIGHRNGAHIPISPPQGIGKVNQNPRAQTPVPKSGALQGKERLQPQLALKVTTAMQKPVPLAPPSNPSSSRAAPAKVSILPKQQQLQTFTSLMNILRSAQLNRMLRSELAEALIKSDPSVYKRASVSRFKTYISKAEAAGIVRAGPPERGGNVWIILVPSYR